MWRQLTLGELIDLEKKTLEAEEKALEKARDAMYKAIDKLSSLKAKNGEPFDLETYDDDDRILESFCSRVGTYRYLAEKYFNKRFIQE